MDYSALTKEDFQNIDHEIYQAIINFNLPDQEIDDHIYRCHEVASRLDIEHIFTFNADPLFVQYQEHKKWRISGREDLFENRLYEALFELDTEEQFKKKAYLTGEAKRLGVLKLFADCLKEHETEYKKAMAERERLQKLREREAHRIHLGIPDWIKDNGEIAEDLFFEAFLKDNELRCINGIFYDIDGQVPEEKLRSDINAFLISHIQTKLASKVNMLLQSLENHCYHEPIRPDPNTIHMLNGYLKTGGSFVPKKEFCLNRLPIAYQKNTSQPVKWLAFLDDLLEREDILTLQEFMGYCLIPSTKAQAMLLIKGNGGEGKSRIGVVLKALFGNNLVSGKVHDIENNRFYTSGLVGKLLFLDDDASLEALEQASKIKQIITADTSTFVEIKGRPCFDAWIYSRIICFSNGTLSCLYDKTDGFFRRIVPLETKPVPPGRRVNPFIAEEIIRDELTGVFFWCFEGLQRLIQKQFQFTRSARSTQLLQEIKEESCNVISFMRSEYVAFGGDYEASNIDLYSEYCNWCRENGLSEMGRNSFLRHLKDNSDKYGVQFSYHVQNGSAHVRGFKGVKTVIKRYVDGY